MTIRARTKVITTVKLKDGEKITLEASAVPVTDDWSLILEFDNGMKVISKDAIEQIDHKFEYE